MKVAVAIVITSVVIAAGIAYNDILELYDLP